MNKKFTIALLSLMLLNCTSTLKTEKLIPLEVETVIGEEGETVVIGPMNRANLDTEEFMSWFQPEYDFLQLSEEWIKEHRPLAKNLTFKLFLGTWCGDTQRELGGMFKILDALEVSNDRIEMYGLTENKDSPTGYEKEYGIINIPTLIFYENGVENNRFVELPVETLLQDISKILKKEPYLNAYADF